MSGEHGRVVEIVLGHADEIVREHGLGGEYLSVREFSFPNGRADGAIFGLLDGMCVVPIAVEARGGELRSENELSRVVSEKMKGVYDEAFTHVYLAVPGIRRGVDDLARRFLRELGYGLILAGESEVNVSERARPKWAPGDAYYEVASRGVLYLAVRKTLSDLGFEVDNVTSNWIGFKRPINYYGALHEGRAVFGIY